MPVYQANLNHRKRRAYREYEERIGRFVPCISLLLFFLLSSAKIQGASDSALQVSVSLNREKIFVGEPVTLKVELRWKPPAQVPSVIVSEENLGSFRVLSTKSSQDQLIKGYQQRETLIQLTSFEIGQVKVPSITIPFTDASGKLQEVKTDSLPIEVMSYLKHLQAGENTPLRPIKPPLHWSMDKRTILLICGLALLGLALLGLIIWIVRRRMRRPKILQASPPLAPDEEALQALSELELSGMADREGAKAYYIRLSEILRRYLGRRYGFDALEMTSSEVMEKTAQLGLHNRAYQLITEDTHESDSVKFAQYVPSRPKREMALQRVRQIVMDTRADHDSDQSRIISTSEKMEEPYTA